MQKKSSTKCLVGESFTMILLQSQIYDKLKKTFSFVVGEKKFNEAKWRRKDENKTKMKEEEIKKKGRKELKRSNLGLPKVQWNVKQHFHLLIMMAIFTCPPPFLNGSKKVGLVVVSFCRLSFCLASRRL